MYQVVKRDGMTVDFDISKISVAMVKAFEALNKHHHSMFCCGFLKIG